MKAIMELNELRRIDQLTEFLSGTQAVAFSIMDDKDACYRWIQGELVRFRYLSLPRQHKGVVLRYLTKVSGTSRQQVTRLVAQYWRRGRVRRRQRTVAGFERKCIAADIRLLAEMDVLAEMNVRHDTPCGQAVKKLCERAYEVFGQAEYKSLASISVSHIENLRKSRAYTRQRSHFEKTRSRRSSIGERRKPRLISLLLLLGMLGG